MLILRITTRGCFRIFNVVYTIRNRCICHQTRFVAQFKMCQSGEQYAASAKSSHLIRAKTHNPFTARSIFALAHLLATVKRLLMQMSPWRDTHTVVPPGPITHTHSIFSLTTIGLSTVYMTLTPRQFLCLARLYYKLSRQLCGFINRCIFQQTLNMRYLYYARFRTFLVSIASHGIIAHTPKGREAAHRFPFNVYMRRARV